MGSAVRAGQPQPVAKGVALSRRGSDQRGVELN